MGTTEPPRHTTKAYGFGMVGSPEMFRGRTSDVSGSMCSAVPDVIARDVVSRAGGGGLGWGLLVLSATSCGMGGRAAPPAGTTETATSRASAYASSLSAGRYAEAAGFFPPVDEGDSPECRDLPRTLEIIVRELGQPRVIGPATQAPADLAIMRVECGVGELGQIRPRPSTARAVFSVDFATAGSGFIVAHMIQVHDRWQVYGTTFALPPTAAGVAERFSKVALMIRDAFDAR